MANFKTVSICLDKGGKKVEVVLYVKGVEGIPEAYTEAKRQLILKQKALTFIEEVLQRIKDLK